MCFVIFGVAVCFLIFGKKEQIGYSQITHNWFSLGISPILYVCMNTFGNIFLIAKTGSYLPKKQMVIASIISSILLTISILIVAICILFGGESVFESDMPMLLVAYKLGTGFGVIYLMTLIVAIFTTICTAAFSICAWLNNFIADKFICAVIVLSIGFVFSRFGFSIIVDIFYPIEGIFGLVFIVICFIYHIKNSNNTDKQKVLPIVDGIEVFKQNGQIRIKKKYRKRN